MGGSTGLCLCIRQPRSQQVRGTPRASEVWDQVDNLYTQSISDELRNEIFGVSALTRDNS